jgi:hypothetical protein
MGETGAQSMLTTKAVWFGHFPDWLLAVGSARMPLMQENSQLLASGFSGRIDRRLKQIVLHFGGQFAPNGGDRSPKSCREFVGSHLATSLARVST